MKNLCSLAAGLFSLIALSAPAHAVTVYTEGFNDDGSGSRYSLTGGGGSGTALWGLQSTGSSVGFTGQEGADFFLGRDMSAAFSGGVNPLMLEIPLAGSIDITGSPATLGIMLAANDVVSWDLGEDFFRIIAIDEITNDEFVLDEFLPNADGNLESSFFAPGAVILSHAFQSLSYDLPAQITQLGIRVEAFSTFAGEYVGFDDIIVGVVNVVPEPGTAMLLGGGLMALACRRRLRAR